MKPLLYLPEYSSGVIVGMYGGRGLMKRLIDMGLTQGTRVHVLKSSGPGPMLIEVRGSRLALGRGVAMKIMIREM